VDRPVKNRLEWIVFAVGLLLVLATLGFLVRESLAGQGGPPEIVARLGTPIRAAGGFMVPVEVTNVGRGTAEDVRVSVILEGRGSEPEEADVDISFLPRESRRSAWVTFPGELGRGQLRLGPIGFEVP
jgi:uncharacterized protein (TIGR02588 family)